MVYSSRIQLFPSFRQSRQSKKVQDLLNASIAFFCGFTAHIYLGRGISHNIGMVDPNIYLGYSIIGEDLNDSIGPTYYQTRIPYVLPLNLFHKFFGVSGPMLLNSFLAGLVVLVPVLIFRGTIRQTWLLAFGLVLSLSWPVSATFSMTYTFGFSIVFLVLFIGLSFQLFLQARNSTVVYLSLIGTTLIYVHPTNSFIVVLSILATWMLDWSRHGYRRITLRFFFLPFLKWSLISAVGWEVVYNTYYHTWHQPQSSLLLSARMSSELQRLGRWDGYPGLREMLSNTTNWVYLVVPIFHFVLVLSVVLLKFFRRASEPPKASFLIVGFLALAVFVAQFFQWLVLGAPLFSADFYFSYFLIGGLFALIFLMSMFPSTLVFGNCLMISVLILFAPRFHLGNFFDLGKFIQGFNEIFSALAVGFLVLGCIMAILFNSVGVRNLFMGLAISVSILASSMYSDVSFILNRQPLNLKDQVAFVEDAEFLTSLWSQLSAEDLTAVWYRNDPSAYLGSLQSTLVFGPTSLIGLADARQIPGPTLENWNCGRFWSTRPDYFDCKSVREGLDSPPTAIIGLYVASSKSALSSVPELKTDNSALESFGFREEFRQGLPSQRFYAVVWEYQNSTNSEASP